MTHADKVTNAEQVVAVFKYIASNPAINPHPEDPTPTTEEGMAKSIMTFYGFDLLEAIAIVKRVEVV